MNHSDAGKPPEGIPPRPNASDAQSETMQLNEEQLAFYRSRLEAGYYRSAVVVKQIAERLAEEVYNPDDQ